MSVDIPVQSLVRVSEQIGRKSFAVTILSRNLAAGRDNLSHQDFPDA